MSHNIVPFRLMAIGAKLLILKGLFKLYMVPSQTINKKTNNEKWVQ